ncbi:MULTISPECIES: Hsp20/alpha crystallin family protein [Mycobacteriaceae]|uniref:Hsp20/alpha crystallin family protein n=1 Tax=Mycolicibacterium austroafricanum TaxID=39687 RepID=A0ABT8H8Y8_MYCAO|nr:MULTISPECIES: Hsp20/alpha crystallin family protein [Mycobacteriaceae]MDN4517229.1 Hsp20/alpha crystallin family protein [Mycolicibacterium austroafricanum]
MTLPVRRHSPQTDRWQPLREFEDLYSQMDRLWQSMLGAAGNAGAWMPSADLTETKDNYVVEVELPGVRQDDIDVELVGNELVISGEIKERKREGLLRRRTRRVGNFEYRATLPGEIRDNDITASLAHGVLTVEVPKARSQSTKIKVIEAPNAKQ